MQINSNAVNFFNLDKCVYNLSIAGQKKLIHQCIAIKLFLVKPRP